MLSTVSPVMVGAEAASPQPTMPCRLDAHQHVVGLAILARHLTGFFIGRLTAIGSMR